MNDDEVADMMLQECLHNAGISSESPFNPPIELADIDDMLSLIHISEPTRLLSIADAGERV